jgi:predicted nuclease of predicted toxin-antitoxin system
MVRLYADENFELPVTKKLREKGYDILTALEAGNANQGIPDEEVLALAIEENRAVITLNYNDFKNLHKRDRNHCGIVICISTRRKEDRDSFANRIDLALRDKESLSGEVIRVNLADRQEQGKCLP